MRSTPILHRLTAAVLCLAVLLPAPTRAAGSAFGTLPDIAGPNGVPAYANGTLTAPVSMKPSGATALSAAGTTQATATPLTLDVNVVTTVASGSGVVLAAYAGPGIQRQEVFNRGANALLVYPPSGAQIEGGAANAAVSIPVGGHATFECVSPTQCYQAP